MKNLQTMSYYNSTRVINQRQKDLTSKEMLGAKEKKEFNQAIITVATTFIVIVTFALLANSGNSYI